MCIRERQGAQRNPLARVKSLCGEIHLTMGQIAYAMKSASRVGGDEGWLRGGRCIPLVGAGVPACPAGASDITTKPRRIRYPAPL